MNSYNIIIPKQILMLTGLAIGLNVIRVIWSDSVYFLFLIWNIYLACIPCIISAALVWYQQHKSNQKEYYVILAVGLLAWLLLFPNAPYVVTDLIHLGRRSIVPIWYDALLLFSTAWVGMLLAMYSLLHIEQLLLTHYSKRTTSFLVMIAVLVSSFGMYIGRFLRWNTWDIFIQPIRVLNDVSGIVLHPSSYIEAYLFTLSFFVFIYVSYTAWKLSLHKPYS